MWLLLGVAVGVLNGALIVRWANCIGPGRDAPALGPLFFGYPLRLGLAALALLMGLRAGIVPALWVFAGLWLARWGVVFWVVRGGTGST